MKKCILLACNIVVTVVIVISLFHALVWNMQTKDYKLVYQPKESEQPKATSILVALSGLKQALTNSLGYNKRVTECREAAKLLLE